MTASVQNWWAAREPREQALLAILAVLASLFILVFLLFLPLQSARADAQTALDQAKTDLAIVSRVAPTLSGGTQSARAPFDRSVLISVSRARGVKLTRVQPGANDSFSVWIDDAQTVSLYGFFEDLLTDYAVTMEQVVVSADANGRLSAQFTVR